MNIVDSTKINIILATFKKGGIICLPTDTILAFSASANNFQAVEKIFDLKQREKNKTLPIFMQDLAMIKKFALLTSQEEQFIKQIWPKAVTIVVRAKQNILPSLLVNNGKIAVRVPNNLLINKICERLNAPIIATSANLSGHQTIKSEYDLLPQMRKKIDLFVKHKYKIQHKNTKPSTIIEFVRGNIKILREGAINFR